MRETGLLLLAGLLCLSCAGRSVQAVPSDGPAEAAEHSRGVFREEGTASWYGREMHGKKTESGDVFDMNELSAAHRTLPFGTKIAVTNLENGRTVAVTVNDRGPFVKDRVLELSFGAARELDFTKSGVARVKIESLGSVADGAGYTVQAGNYAEEKSARFLKDRLSRKYSYIYIVPVETARGKFYRVRVGDYDSREKAEIVAGRLALEGVEPLVLRKD